MLRQCFWAPGAAACASPLPVLIPGFPRRFDVPQFYKECRRILRPGAGAMAVFGYMPTRIRFPGSEEAGKGHD